MLRKIRYTYCVQGKKGIENYSGIFETEFKAKIWYAKYGFKLEELFNRELILFKTDEPKRDYKKSTI